MWPFDQNNQPTYQQYAQAYDTGSYNNIDPYQAFGHVQQFMQNAPYDMQQRVYQQHFEQMPYEQRVALAQQVPPQYGIDPNNPWAMAQGFLRLGQEQPGFLRQVFNHPLLLGSAAVLAGLIAKHVMDHHRQQEYGRERGYAREQPYGYNPGYQDQYAGGGYSEERREERELRSEIRREERELDRLEERERHHHHHREEY